MIAVHFNWYTARNLGCTNPCGEVNVKPSKTVPGMAMSLEELLKRYVRGETVPTFSGTYAGDDDDLPDLTGLTPMDMMDMASNLKTAISRKQSKRPAPGAALSDPPPTLPASSE
ncbi:MAG: hypothetical protein [Microvirus sp.]|nr:MAG: hypothetical protein [Microvirus sp.]